MKYRFPYRLLSDPGGKIAKLYGAFQEGQALYPARNTYVIDAEGKLAQVLDGVNAKTHAKDLLDSLG